VQPVPELDLAPDGRPARPRRQHERPLARDPRALDEHVDAVEQREVVLVPEQPVGPNDLHPPRLQRLGGRDARAGESVDERAPQGRK
jgi:hypothetical protein